MIATTWTPQEVEDLAKLSKDAFLAKYPHRTDDSWHSKRRRERLRQYYRPPSQAEQEPEEVPLRAIEETLLKALKDRTLTVEELADEVDRGPSTVRDILDGLRTEGYEIQLDESGQATLDRQYKPTNWTIDLTPYYRDRFKLGLISCSHFGNRYRQLRALTSFYRICERDEVEAVLHAGDLTDGLFMYKGQQFDLYAQGMDEQVKCTVDEYPESEIPTYITGGNHDYTYVKRAGANVVRRVCAQRANLHYAGMLSATYMVGPIKVLVLHSRGGVPYARSYRSQRLNEQLGRGEQVPQLFSIGGLHVIDYVHYLGVHTFLCGCFQGQTPYLKEKGLYPEIGGWIAEFGIAEDGTLNRCRMEWVGFEEQKEFGD